MFPARSSRDRASGISRRAFFGAAAGTSALTLLRPTAVLSGLPAEALRLRDDYVGRLCFNENPRGPSPLALAAMSESLQLGHRYPDWFAETLCQELAAYHAVLPLQVRAGCGGTEMLHLCALALAHPGDNVICPYPSYDQFSGDADFLGAEVRYVALDGNHRINLNGMAARVDANTTAVCLTNPNNPTGPVLSAAAIAAFVDALPAQVAVIIDEAYHHYVHDSAYKSAIELVQQGKKVVVIRTFSKVFGLAGVRVGYAVGHSGVMGSLAPWQTWGTISRPSQEAARAALNDATHVADTVSLNDQARQYCYDQFDEMGLDYILSEGNFFMVDVGQPSGPVASALAARGILVRTGWGMPNHLRVSTGLMAETQDFITQLRDILSTSAAGERPAPASTMLHGNFPNPVEEGTRLVFSVGAPESVRLEVFDIAGRLVDRVVDAAYGPGYYEIRWSRLDRSGKRLPAGSYYYRFTAGRRIQTRRMILL